MSASLPSTSQVFERRQINDEIEDTYIKATQAAANCQTAISVGKGNYYTLYRDFFQYFYHLFDMTRDTKELLDKEPKLCDEISLWFINQNNLFKLSQKEIVSLIRSGLDLYRKYKKVLAASGVISLPSSKR